MWFCETCRLWLSAAVFENHGDHEIGFDPSRKWEPTDTKLVRYERDGVFDDYTGPNPNELQR